MACCYIVVQFMSLHTSILKNHRSERLDVPLPWFQGWSDLGSAKYTQSLCVQQEVQSNGLPNWDTSIDVLKNQQWYVRKHAIMNYDRYTLLPHATQVSFQTSWISFQVFHSLTAPTQRCQPQLNDFQPRTTFVANLGQSMNTLANNLRSSK